MNEEKRTSEKRKTELEKRLQEAEAQARYYCQIANETGRKRVREISDFSKLIVDCKQAEDALRESELKFRTLFDLSPQAIALAELKTGSIVDINNKFCAITKYTRDELIGRTAMELGLYSELERERFVTELRPSREVCGLEMDFIARDGSVVNALMFAKVIQIGGGTFLFAVVLDVTDLKRLESQLQHAQKMEALGTLAGGIAHDFNNLLMGIQGNASLLLYDIDSTHPHYEPLKNIENQVRSGAKLTSQLLGYARKGKYDVKSIDLNRIIEETSSAFARTRKEVNTRCELAEDLFGVEGDQGQIEQVLLNLYVNASDAMPNGGELILRTMNATHMDMKGKKYDPKRGRYVVLEVTDTGVGMDPETRGRIFEPFFTTKEMGRGTGLGLASVYGIVKGHGGYIDVSSERGEGTTFTIHLPATDQAAPRLVELRHGAVKGCGMILLVDDEDKVLEISARLLRRHGYSVITANTGSEAVVAYQENKDQIDLVILDMVMPGMGGGEVYDKLKEINPNVKVLLSSGYSREGQADEILNRGCNGFVQKPFTVSDLSRKMRDILGS